MSALAATAGERPAAERTGSDRPSLYLQLLGWTFTAFNATRILSYVPTLWAIRASADSSQHSLLTWLCWLGANATMAAWLFENNRRRLNPVIAISLCNASMCLLTSALIVWYRT